MKELFALRMLGSAKNSSSCPLWKSSKKAYFFTLDAIVGFALLLIGVAIFLNYEIETVESQSFDFVNYVKDFYGQPLDNLDLSQSTNKLGQSIKDCYYSGECDLNNHLDQQILSLCEEDSPFCNSIVNSSITALLESSPLSNSELALLIGCVSASGFGGLDESGLGGKFPFSIIYNTTDFNKMENASDIASSKWVVVSSSKTGFYGPCVFEVVTWAY